MMVRSEVDACNEDADHTSSAPGVQTHGAPRPAARYPAIRPRVAFGGKPAPQAALVEIKTTSKHIKLMDTFTQMFFAQTPRLVVGTHARGTFHTLETHELGAGALATAEVRMQPAFARLARLLRSVREMAVERGAPCALVWSSGTLTVHNADEHVSELPEELLARFSAAGTA
jgi:hypothetical protein